MLAIDERVEKGIAILVVDGRVDSDGAPRLDSALRNALAKIGPKIVLDLAKVRYMNSSGLRTLADVLTKCRANGGDLRLVAPSTRVQHVFQVAGFDKYFSSYDTAEAALTDF